jgi:hypothetical protein
MPGDDLTYANGSHALGPSSGKAHSLFGTHLPRRQEIRVYERARRCQHLHPPLAPNPSKPQGIFAQVRVMPQVLPFRLREVQVPSTPQDPLGEILRGFVYLDHLSGPAKAVPVTALQPQKLPGLGRAAGRFRPASSKGAARGPGERRMLAPHPFLCDQLAHGTPTWRPPE